MRGARHGAEDRYLAKVARIREYIAAGDIYQANFTFPLYFPWAADVWSLYRRMSPMQRVLYGAVVDLPELKIASLPPSCSSASAAPRSSRGP